MVNHLWIDSLCIAQDDEKKWHQESALISGVYGKAFVNIAAAAAKDGSFGVITNLFKSSLSSCTTTKDCNIINFF